MKHIKDVGNECAVLKTRMAARNVTRAYDKALRPLGLKSTQFTLLVAIHQGAPRSVSRLADFLAMERTTLTRNLQLLEKEGHIEMSPEGYRRERGMKLTAAGEALLAKALPIWRATQDRFVAAVGNDDWHSMAGALERISRIE